MAFRSLVSLRLQQRNCSTSDLVRIAGDIGVCALFLTTSARWIANIDARGKERLAERTRIAQELQDILLQGFLAVSMQLLLLQVAVDYLPWITQLDLVLLSRIGTRTRGGTTRRPRTALGLRGLSIPGAGPCRCSERLGSPLSGGISSGDGRPAAGTKSRAA